jgi:hypothetical protein
VGRPAAATDTAAGRVGARTLFNVLVEELEQDPGKFAVRMLGKVFEGEGAGALRRASALRSVFFFAGLQLSDFFGR